MAERTTVLQGEMTISSAAEHRLLLLSALNDLGGASGETLCLDLSAVTTIDSAGIQLLLSMRHSLAGRAQTLQLIDCQAAVRDALRCVGLDRGARALLPAGAQERT